ncbi:MAG: signal peptidase I [Gammaproteobacteria bacterium]|nr:signal peptidase I [Gammaproteobacteria bacterium]
MQNKPGKLRKLLQNNRGLIVFAFLMVVFRGAIADWNVVPTGSMNPTIIEGDRILVNKLAYDVNLPFTTFSLLQLGNPGRGDIVVFESGKAGKRLVKRVVAVPGDVVLMRDNHLIINGEAAVYQPLGQRTPDNPDSAETLPAAAPVTVTESILEYSHPVQLLHRHRSPLQNFGPVTVPDDHYLMMGDNRDNSADSRVYGFVPRGEITGQAKRVLFSLDYNRYYLPRAERVLTPLL